MNIKLRVFSVSFFLALLNCCSIESNKRDENVQNQGVVNVKKIHNVIKKDFYPNRVSYSKDTLHIHLYAPPKLFMYKRKKDAVMRMLMLSLKNHVGQSKNIKIYSKSAKDSTLVESFIFPKSRLKKVYKIGELSYEYQKFIADSLDFKNLYDLNALILAVYKDRNEKYRSELEDEVPSFLDVVNGYYKECIGKIEGDKYERDLRSLKDFAHGLKSAEHYKPHYVDFFLEKCQSRK